MNKPNVLFVLNSRPLWVVDSVCYVKREGLPYFREDSCFFCAKFIKYAVNFSAQTTMARDSHYYKTCCCHVHKATFVLAILGLVGGFLTLGEALFKDYMKLVPAILSLMTYTLILLGNRQHKHVFYIPALVLGVSLFKWDKNNPV
jgi:hypothetical protein